MKAGAIDLARFVALRDSVARVARLLAPAAIEVAPLKGALVLVGYAKEPRPRAIGDIDLLVRDERFDEAVAILKAHGARVPVENPDGRTSTLELRGLPFPIDLHRRLFRHGLYDFDERAILARSRRDAESFGESVRILAPEDAIAHAIAHHAGGRPLGPAQQLANDLAVLGASVDRARLEHRIREFGLIRAVFFAELDFVRRGVASVVVDDLVRRLEPSRVDRCASSMALSLAANESAASSLARHLTNSSLPKAARSLAWHVGTTLAHRARSA